DRVPPATMWQVSHSILPAVRTSGIGCEVSTSIAMAYWSWIRGGVGLIFWTISCSNCRRTALASCTTPGCRASATRKESIPATWGSQSDAHSAAIRAHPSGIVENRMWATASGSMDVPRSPRSRSRTMVASDPEAIARLAQYVANNNLAEGAPDAGTALAYSGIGYKTLGSDAWPRSMTLRPHSSRRDQFLDALC